MSCGHGTLGWLQANVLFTHVSFGTGQSDAAKQQMQYTRYVPHNLSNTVSETYNMCGSDLQHVSIPQHCSGLAIHAPDTCVNITVDDPTHSSLQLHCEASRSGEKLQFVAIAGKFSIVTLC